MTQALALDALMDAVGRNATPPDRRRVRLSAAGLKVAPMGAAWRGRAAREACHQGLVFVIWENAPTIHCGNWRAEFLETA